VSGTPQFFSVAGSHSAPEYVSHMGQIDGFGVGQATLAYLLFHIRNQSIRIARPAVVLIVDCVAERI
jgi:hypothetical protein